MIEEVKQIAKEEHQCPVCYDHIEIQDGAGYCILCEEVVYETDDGLESDLLDLIVKQD